MNILITAGGNTEKIDDVRAIRNTGTGRLGALIAEKFLSVDDGACVYYICDRHAVTPNGNRVTITHADDVTSLETAVRNICSERRIDAVVHSMAVSDYRVKNVTTAMDAANAAEECYRSKSRSYDDDYTIAPSDLTNTLADSIASARDVRGSGKVSSDLDDVLVVLERAPKVISLYRTLAPGAVIVGFKLLADVEEDELIHIGYDLLKRNDCDYVLANDMKYLNRGGHIGHLIERDGSHKIYDGKDAIAGAIVDAVKRKLS